MYKSMSRLRNIMTKIFHACDDCKPMIGMCHSCFKSGVKIEDRRMILCHGCCQAL